MGDSQSFRHSMGSVLWFRDGMKRLADIAYSLSLKLRTASRLRSKARTSAYPCSAHEDVFEISSRPIRSIAQQAVALLAFIIYEFRLVVQALCIFPVLLWSSVDENLLPGLSRALGAT